LVSIAVSFDHVITAEGGGVWYLRDHGRERLSAETIVVIRVRDVNDTWEGNRRTSMITPWEGNRRSHTRVTSMITRPR